MRSLFARNLQHVHSVPFCQVCVCVCVEGGVCVCVCVTTSKLTDRKWAWPRPQITDHAVRPTRSRNQQCSVCFLLPLLLPVSPSLSPSSVIGLWNAAAVVGNVAKREIKIPKAILIHLLWMLLLADGNPRPHPCKAAWVKRQNSFSPERLEFQGAMGKISLNKMVD